MNDNNRWVSVAEQPLPGFSESDDVWVMYSGVHEGTLVMGKATITAVDAKRLGLKGTQSVRAGMDLTLFIFLPHSEEPMGIAEAHVSEIWNDHSVVDLLFTVNVSMYEVEQHVRQGHQPPERSIGFEGAWKSVLGEGQNRGTQEITPRSWYWAWIEKLCVIFKDPLQRERDRIRAEIDKIHGLVGSLMTQRNGARWTAEERLQLVRELRNVAALSPYLVALMAPGSFVLVPVVAWLLDRRRRIRVQKSDPILSTRHVVDKALLT